MSNIVVELSPERNFSDQSDEEIQNKYSQQDVQDLSKIREIPFYLENSQVDDDIQENMKQFEAIQKDHDMTVLQLSYEHYQQEQVDDDNKENIDESHILNGSEQQPIQRISVKDTKTPELFSLDSSEQQQNFAPFGKKQSVVSFDEMKQVQRKQLPKWNNLTKTQTQKQDPPDKKINQLVNDKTKTIKLITPEKRNISISKNEGKYAKVQSKVKLAVQNRNSNHSHQAIKPIKAFNNSKSQKHFSDLNISKIGFKQSKQDQKAVDVSVIQDLIELDFSSMINQINQKKDFLLDKIKTIQRQTNQQVTVNYGSIIRNGSRNNSEVNLIDLYSNMLSQKTSKNQQIKHKTHQETCRNKSNLSSLETPTENFQLQRSLSVSKKNSPEQTSPKQIQRREPGKIVRQQNSVKKYDDETFKYLEDKYDSAINYALEVQKELQTFKNTNNNKQMSI